MQITKPTNTCACSLTHTPQKAAVLEGPAAVKAQEIRATFGEIRQVFEKVVIKEN